jgi:uncharacterized protein (TIGR00725 family)
MLSRKIQIGVIGYAGVVEYPKGRAPKESIYQDAERVGFLLAEKGAIVVTGGKSGVMEYAARGARKANGVTVGVIKGNQRFRSNDFTDVEIVTGMTADGFDELLLVSMCDALIAIGGGAGTLEELAIAYRNKKPVIVLEKTGGWADKTSRTYLDERETMKIKSAATPEEAVGKAIKYSRQSYAK